MADRRDLTVSKPNPLNARQEAFAAASPRAAASGDAYKRAGYTSTRDGVADVKLSVISPP